MRKRVLSLLLVLCLLLGLLPSAVLAAPVGEERPESPLGEDALLPPELPVEQPDSSASWDADDEGLPLITEAELPEVPAVEEDPSATLWAATSPLTIELAGSSSCRSHHGDNWNAFGINDGDHNRASYDGGIVNVDYDATSISIYTKESDHFKRADYLYMPFTLSAEVPAHSSATYDFTITLWHKRNSKGGVHYWLELLDPSKIGTASLNTSNNTTLSPGSLGLRVKHDNKDGGSGTFSWSVTFDNYEGTTAKQIDRQLAYWVGACKSTSGLSSYHHQVESSATFTVKNATTYKRITYNNNGGSGSTLAQSFSSSSTRLAAAPTKTGYDFLGWKDSVGGTVYAAGAAYSQNRGAAMTAQWRAKSLNVTFDPNGGTVSQSQKSVTYGETYGTLPTPTRTGYQFVGWTSGPTGGQVYYTHTKVTETKDHTLYAYWTVKVPTVTFNAGGGTVSQTSKRAVYGDPYGALPTPTRTGYTFDGWYTAQTGGNKVESATKVANGDDHTLYAHWTAKTVAVTLNYGDGRANGSLDLTYGGKYAGLPAPTRQNYAFTGWYTAASGGSKVESSTKVTNANAHTLYARWSRNTYTVTFHAAGGSAVSSRTVNAGSALGALPATTRTGYTFGGWFSGDTQVTKDTVPAGDVTYAARWTANTYTVSYNANGGAFSGDTGKSVTYDQTYGALPTPTRVGYTFGGWYTAATGGNQVTAGTTVTTASDHTLYAHWTPISYTVTYDANGGTVSQSGVSVIYDGAYGALLTPTRTGYTFDGWYTAPVGGTQVTAATKVTATDKHTLYAHWTAKTPTVTFDPNGGSVDTTTKAVTFGQPYGSLPVPTHPEGKVFRAWYDASSGGNFRDASSLVTKDADHTLYARWETDHTHRLGAADFGDKKFSALGQTADSGNSVTAASDVLGTTISASKNCFLATDVTIGTVTVIPSGVTLNLCLNGHKLTYNGAGDSAFVVQDGGKLNICDCNGSHGSNQFTSPVTGENVTISGGLITRSVAYTSVGTGVYVKGGGAFNLYSGAIAGIQAADPKPDTTIGDGTVRVEGTFHMYGGELCHNKIGCGGAVNICDANGVSSHFYLHGGSIHHNYACLDDGGAICVNASAACTISGGSIVDNAAQSGGGGIHSYGGGIELSGSPVIQNNTTKTGGTNYSIRLDGGAKLTVNDGFSSAAPIGVSSTTAPTADSPVAVGTDGSGAYARYFLADAAGQEVVDDSGVLSLVLHHHKVNPAAGSFADFTALTAEMINSGAEGNIYTLPAGNYYLSGDITTEKVISVASGTVQLCLNGHKIENTKSCISVKLDATLNICDCRGGGGIVSSYNSASAYGIYNSGTVNLYSGAVSGAKYGIYSNGAVNVYGGAITDGDYGSSAGIHNYQSGKVNVYGGTITGKTSGISNASTVNVSGGTIIGSKNGIGCSASANITVTGGVISGAENGVYISGTNSSVIARTFSGGAISGGNCGVSGYIKTLSGAPTITGEVADICAWSAFTAENLTGQFSVVYQYAITETAPQTITTAATASQLDHFTPARDGIGLRDVVDGDGNHTLQLYKLHMHDGEEYENYTVLTADTALTDGGHYLLTADLNRDGYGTLTVPEGATVDLCLNGHELSGGSISVYGTLNLYDCVGTGKVKNGGAVIQGAGTVNYYGGTLEGGKSTLVPLYASGVVNLYATPAITADESCDYEIRGNIPGFLHIAAPLTKPTTPLRVNFGTADEVNITTHKQVTVTTGWAERMGEAEAGDYFAPSAERFAKVEQSGDELVLRLLRVDMDGVTHYPSYTTGKLTTADLTAPETRVGYLWDGWYTAEEGGDKVTADTVFTDDATLYPRWTACDHSGNTAEPTVVDATCTTAGSSTYTCSVCGLTVVTELKALDHDFETDTTWHVDAEGGVHYHQCSRCDQRQDEAEHTWGDGVVTTAPTAGAEGVMTFTCTACSATTTEAIPALTAHSVTYTVDAYTNGSAPTQADAVKGETVTLPTGLTRTGYTLSGWALLDGEGVPTVDGDGAEVLYIGTFTMPDRDVTFQVRWERVESYELQPGETIVLEDGTVIQNETGGTVTIDQGGDGTPETTITLPGGGSVTIQEGQNGGKDKVVVPPGAEVTTTPGDGGQGPVITIGQGEGKVDPSGKVDAPVGTTVVDKDGNVITITGGEGGAVDPEGVVTFPEGVEGKVTVTDPDNNTVSVDVPGGGEGLDVTPGGVPLVNDPGGSLTILDSQGGSTTVTVPDSEDGTGGAEVDDKGNLILPGGSTVETEDGEGNKTTTTVPDQGGSVTPGGEVGPRRPDRELFIVTDIDPEHVTGSIAISADADKMEWRKAGEENWTSVIPEGGTDTTANLPELDEGTYEFRYKAEGELDASLPREIRVDNKPEGGKALNIDPGITGGTVSAVRTRVKPGFEVRLTVKPAQDYRLASLTVTYEGGEPITPVWSTNTLTYNFTMPDADVTVTATFAAIAPPTPTATPSAAPSVTPSAAPSVTPSAAPSVTPSAAPSVTPSARPSAAPSVTPSAAPSVTPSATPSAAPSVTPSARPSAEPSDKPVPRTFTVSFDPQGGRPAPADQTVARGKLAAKPATPAKDGFTFRGWFTETDGGKPWQFNSYTVSADTTLYALWAAKRPGVAVTPEDPVDIPGGGAVTQDPDTGDVTITPPEGAGGTTTTITPPESGGDVTVDPDTGEVTVPGGSTVDPGNGVKVELPDGGTVDSQGAITLPDGGDAVTIPDGEGGSTTITAPDGGGVIKPTEDGGLEIPGGSTVKTGEDSPAVTVGDQGGKVDSDGTVTVPGGSTLTIPDGSGGKTEITVPTGTESQVKPTDDGKLEVPEGSTVKKPDGSTVTVPSGGGIIDPATGDMTPLKPDEPTPPEPTPPKRPSGGGSSTSSRPSVSTGGQGGKVEADRSGNVTITPDQGYVIDRITVNGQEVAVPADGTLTGLTRTDKVVVTFKKAPTATVDPFTDVKPTDWFYDSAKAMVERGLMNGTSETAFAPGLTTSRVMIATIIWRLAGSPEPEPEAALPYPDCDKDSWYAKAVAWASERGVVKGYDNGGFGPDDPITREQLAAMLWRYAGEPAASSALNAFTDADRAGSWAMDALRWAVEQGILTGKGGGVLDPAGPATRAEAAAMLARFSRSEA